ncbi:hypothetical protein OS493_023162 [Desmophyllum pertusum]|uniref:Uncharacterized protein n=1 Tax=Desmophyllum pertusum TaxID=174260 RepID=A0A9W9YYH8_9CNID|nr:hypothetical protein OS493_023162 [Desmophyllum pertusum]
MKKLTLHLYFCSFPPCKVRVLTNNGGVGRYGPSILKYQGDLKQEVKVSSQHPGIQLWTIPVSGLWSIEARGASGADGILVGSSGNRKRGGYGATVKGSSAVQRQSAEDFGRP